ncbi:MAG TPA: phospholipase domain-containing protein, partial [Puia sp.]
NKGTAGVVYHVYDLKHLDRIPRRYTVEAGKSLTDSWYVSPDKGNYDLEVYAPNGYFQKFSGNLANLGEPEITLDYNHRNGAISVAIENAGGSPVDVTINSNAYDYGGPWSAKIAPGSTKTKSWELNSSGNWYDFSVKAGDVYIRRFAGRVETGQPSVTDPAMAMGI